MSIVDPKWFSGISRPSRYLGGEVNAVTKDPGRIDVSVALAFPDVYEVGMSHLGLKILYHLLNAQDWLAAERVFCPWVDLETEMRRWKHPLTTLESDRPLEKFDVVGFSLQHELSYTNVLNMLDLGNIPFLASDRSDSHPLIIAGGPACFNPEPVADFFDLIVIGDGESAALDICRAVRAAKRGHISGRKELLSELRHVQGIYIPSFFSVQYKPDGRVEEIVSEHADYPHVKKAILPDLDVYPFPERLIIPFTELVHDRVSIEISRGCTRGCRFCQAGMIYRPVRERSLPSIIKKAENTLKQTGYDDLSLLSLSSGDYSAIGPLLQCLMDRLAPDNIGVSLPSLRVDSLDPLMMEQIKRVRKTGFTLAPEAGNDRLRRIINKGLTDEEILRTSQAVYQAGWNLIKLYFMIGLPFEETDDVRDIVHLAREIAGMSRKRGKRANLNVSISTFVPKAHTPFMWTAQVPLQESKNRVRLIQEGLRRSRVRVKWNQPELSWLEGIFSRGDRRMGRVVTAAWARGARFDAWSEHFRKDIWEAALAQCGLDPDAYLYRERALNEVLPWDHIQSGVHTSFLKKEWLKAGQATATPDCRKKCLECGVCDHHEIDPVLYTGPDPAPAAPGADARAPSRPEKKFRITYRKLDAAKYLSHLELVRVFIRAFRRAGLKLAFSKGFHPMPRVSFLSALPVGTASMAETMHVELRHAVDAAGLTEKLCAELPPGVDIRRIEEIPLEGKRVRVRETRFQVTLNALRCKEKKLEQFFKSDYFPVVKHGKKGEHAVDARSLVSDMSFVSPDTIRLTLLEREGPALKPLEIVKGIFSLDAEDLFGMEVIKTGQVLA